MVLVIVLWIITLLTVMASSFVYSMRTETMLATHAVERAQARALAEAGLRYAVLRVLYPVPALEEDTQDEWPVDGSLRNWQFGAGQIGIRVVDVSGKIDLNRADRKLLGGLLLTAGVPEDSIDSLLDAIEDWRDPDDLRRLNGAESAEYQAAGRDVGPKNGFFESVEELQQVLGITQAIYQRIADKLTVFSRQPGIDPATAPAEVLRALPEADPETIEAYLMARIENANQGLPPPPAPPIGPYLSRARGLAYDIGVTAQLASGVTASIAATVARPRQPEQAYTLLAWHEGR
jgi:general secretion pathway protein K